MTDTLAHVPELEIKAGASLVETLRALGCPAVVRGAVSHWPAVGAAGHSARAAADYIAQFSSGLPAPYFEGAPDTAGRFFYNAAMDGFNYAVKRAPLRDLLDRLVDAIDVADAPFMYAGSLTIAGYVPDFARTNSLRAQIPAATVAESIWIGNRTLIPPHYDNTENIAVCVAGRRRFTLFPTEQIANLYPGPPDFTPAGQMVSQVDIRHPDFDRFPRYALALKAAQVAELEPGDALYIPTLWWHGVESLTDFGVLVNYWWRDVADDVDSPANTLLHAALSLKDLPPAQKARWKAIFDHLIFGAPLADLPATAKTLFAGPITPQQAAAVRAFLAKSLSR